LLTDNPSAFLNMNAGVFDAQPITKAIRLKPSVTDYATFVATTSKVLGTTGPASRKNRPSQRVLPLARPNRAPGAQ
jgi:hypothetical protein